MLLALLLVSVAPQGWTLGLGEIELRSALNERLDARIGLRDAGGLQPTEILVSLASAEDFQRVGVERFFFLTNLRFEVDFARDGASGVRVTSAQPITEPYLNFVVEVLWPGGRMLREYTLLLDPPTFSQTRAPAVSAPARTAPAETRTGVVDRAPVQAPLRGTEVQLGAREPGGERSALDEGVVDGQYRMTDRTDTLWSIASRTRPSNSVSVHQNMLAIQRLNPDAFLRGNINLLKAGYSLRLPSESEALALSSAEAADLVAMQNQEWRTGGSGDPASGLAAPPQVAERPGSDTPAPQGRIDATARPVAAEDSGPAVDGQLRIVAGTGESAVGSADAAQGGEQLTIALEERDRLNLEVEELTRQLGREQELVANQLAVKDRQLEVRDQQIAEMQAEMERVRQELAAAQQQRQNQSAPSGAETSWWQSPLVFGALLGVVVLLLVVAMIATRRRRQADDDFYAPAVADVPLADTGAGARYAPTVALAGAIPATGAATGAVAEDSDAALAESLANQDLVADAADAVHPAGSEPVGSETSDVIGEADIYIAYGRYTQAIGLLQGVLEDSPDRNDVRLKLLELYAETGARPEFEQNLAELIARCDDEEALLTAERLSQTFQDPEPDPAAGQSATADPLAEDLAEIDDLEASSELSLVPMDDTPSNDAPSNDTPSNDGALSADDAEFELEIDGAAEARSPVRHPPPRFGPEAEDGDGAGDLLGGDLGIDFKLDEAEADDLPDPATGSAEYTTAEDSADVRETPAGAQNFAADATDGRSAPDAADDSDFDFIADAAVTDDDLLDLDSVEDPFDFADDGDAASTKLDLARAYIDMGDQDGARDILNEVVAEGSPEQQQQARALLEGL